MITWPAPGQGPSADNHPDQSTENPSPAVFRISRRNVTQRNGYKWCQTESTRIDYTIMRIHILYSSIRYQNDQSPGFRQAPRLRSDPRNRLWMWSGCRRKALRSLRVSNVKRSFRLEAKLESTPLLLDSRDLTIVRVWERPRACELTNAAEAETSPVPAAITLAASPPGRYQIPGTFPTCLPVP